jgi:hypothetical protein
MDKDKSLTPVARGSKDIARRKRKHFISNIQRGRTITLNTLQDN